MTKQRETEEPRHLHRTTRLNPSRHELEALYGQIGRYCWFLANDAGTQTGTAILISLGDRRLLATAAHVVEGCERIGAARPNRAGAATSPCRVIAVSPEADVAVLAPPPGAYEDLRKGAAVPERLLLSRLPRCYEHPVLIAGFPAVLFTRTRNSTGVALCTYNGCTARNVDWPTARFDGRPLDPARDLIIPTADSYDLSLRDADDVTRIWRTAEGPIVPPKGVSGGGIWLAADRTGTVWSPDCSLIGIQVSTLPGRKYLRGTSICAWLELVGGSFPDLKPAIRRINRNADAFWRKQLRRGEANAASNVGLNSTL